MNRKLTVQSSDYDTLYIKIPTYFQDIFRTEEYVNLIFKKTLESRGTPPEHIQVNEINTSEETDFELTGNPLEIDLGESISFKVLNLHKRKEHWTKEEATYGPINLAMARHLLNTTKNKDISICLCNALDPRKTLAIFQRSKEFYRGTVQVYGCYFFGQEETSFDTMLAQHKKICLTEAKPKLSLHALYAIMGNQKRTADDVDPKDSENCAFIETFSNEPLLDSAKNEYKLFLQVNVTNPDSIFYPLWQQMEFLQTLITEMRDDDELEKLKISDNPVPLDNMISAINNLLMSFELRQYEWKTSIDWKKFDAVKMRKLDFLEQLWELLKTLGTLEDVRECIYMLFTDVSELRHLVPITKTSKIGLILNGLKDGNIAMPTLSMQTTLNLFTELGLNKLYNDYIYLLASWEPDAKDYFLQLWLALGESTTTLTKPNFRKTRLLFSNTTAASQALVGKLNQLARMHVTTELMRVSKDCYLSGSETLYHVNHRILDNTRSEQSYQSLKSFGVVDFECELYVSQVFRLKDWRRTSINVRYSSTGRSNSSVSTIFHFSENPIFPKTVFEDYDAEMTENEEKYYYVYKSNIFIN